MKISRFVYLSTTVIKSTLHGFFVKKYLKKNAMNKKSSEKQMKVAFIVFEPETWDKESPVYVELKKRNIETDLIVVPSFDRELKLTKEFGNEWDYFKSVDEKAIPAYDANGKIVDLKSMEYDYMFYQDPYNAHMPPKLRSDYTVKFSKVCYIPYGFSGANVFNGGNTNRAFFQNIYLGFLDVKEIYDTLSKRYSSNCKKKYQNFFLLGYPAFEEYFNMNWDGSIQNILWTPRWSYAPKIGGSHFMEYKDSYLELKNMYRDYDFAIRPHPMMFSNFINEERMSQQEVESYKKNAKKLGVEISQGKTLDEDFKWADVLITDYSSIIPMYFLTGKPIIYCHHDIEWNSAYNKLKPGIYWAETWDDVQEHLENILSGNDYLIKERNKIGAEFAEEHRGAASRIVDTIVNDFNE